MKTRRQELAEMMLPSLLKMAERDPAKADKVPASAFKMADAFIRYEKENPEPKDNKESLAVKTWDKAQGESTSSETIVLHGEIYRELIEVIRFYAYPHTWMKRLDEDEIVSGDAPIFHDREGDGYVSGMKARVVLAKMGLSPFVGVQTMEISPKCGDCEKPFISVEREGKHHHWRHDGECKRG